MPEKWATFKAQEQNHVHTEEETVPMQEQKPVDATVQNAPVNA